MFKLNGQESILQITRQTNSQQKQFAHMSMNSTNVYDSILSSKSHLNPHYVFNQPLGNKLHFILNLIEKYQIQPITENMIRLNTISQHSQKSSEQNQNQTQPHQQPNNQILNYLSSSPLNVSSYENDHHSPTKQITSEFTSNLEQTHQRLIHKFLTPTRNTQPDTNSTNSTNSNLQKTIDEFQHSSHNKGHSKIEEIRQKLKEENLIYKQHSKLTSGNLQLTFRQQFVQNKMIFGNDKQTLQIIDQKNIPLIQSVIMTDYRPETKVKVKQKQNTQMMSEEKEIRINESTKVDNDLSLEDVLLFCLIVLAFFMWKM